MEVDKSMDVDEYVDVDEYMGRGKSTRTWTSTWT